MTTTDHTDGTDTETTLAFVCVQNAGRSQMSAAFAERERDERRLDGVRIVTGGTHPADAVHDEVVTVMEEVGIDISDRTPREVSSGELADADLVVTMGCSTLDLDADTEVRDWALTDPHGRPVEEVREVRDDIADRIERLFDERFGDGSRSGMTDLIAHRGFAGDHPENTLGAFTAAARSADAIEFDVRRCASGELVVFHDETLDRVTDRCGVLSETTFDTLRECEVLGSGESVPRLETVVDAVPESVGLHVELKERGLADDAVRVLAAASNDVTISAFDARVLEAVTEADPEMSTAYLFMDDPHSGITAATTLDCDYVHPHYRLVLETDLLDRARDHGLGVNVWTVADGSVGGQLLESDIDGVIADSRDVLSR